MKNSVKSYSDRDFQTYLGKADNGQESSAPSVVSPSLAKMVSLTFTEIDPQSTPKPLTIDQIRRYVGHTNRALLFAPAKNSPELAISPSARALLDFFPSPQTKQTLLYLWLHIANKLLPEDSPTYQPRTDLMEQQDILRQIGEMGNNGGGALQLPDLTLRLAQKKNNGTSYMELQLPSNHLFSKDNVFLGTLYRLHHSPLTATAYEHYRENQQLIAPTPDELTNLINRFLKRYAQQKDLPSPPNTASAMERMGVQGEAPAYVEADIWNALLRDVGKDFNSLTFEQFRQRLDQWTDAADLAALREADRMAAELRDAVQASIRKTLGIEGPGTVSFHNIISSYTTKTGEVRTYTRLKASWRQGKKMCSMDVPQDKTSAPTPT
jgi:hypothetical protein